MAETHGGAETHEALPCERRNQRRGQCRANLDVPIPRWCDACKTNEIVEQNRKALAALSASSARVAALEAENTRLRDLLTEGLNWHISINECGTPDTDCDWCAGVRAALGEPRP